MSVPNVPGRPAVLRTAAGRSLGGLLLAAYGPGSTLAYHELLGVGGVVGGAVPPAAWISHAYVDDSASVAGGRGVWGIAKEAAAFTWRQSAGGDEVTVALAGREILSVTVATRPRSAPVIVAAPFAGRDGSRRAWALGRLRGAPVSARVGLPPDSPLASLAPVFSRTAVAGDVFLRITAPR